MRFILAWSIQKKISFGFRTSRWLILAKKKFSIVRAKQKREIFQGNGERLPLERRVCVEKKKSKKRAEQSHKFVEERKRKFDAPRIFFWSKRTERKRKKNSLDCKRSSSFLPVWFVKEKKSFEIWSSWNRRFFFKLEFLDGNNIFFLERNSTRPIVFFTETSRKKTNFLSRGFFFVRHF